MSINSENSVTSFFPASPKIRHLSEGGQTVSVETMSDFTVEIRVSSAEALNRLRLNEFKEELEAAAIAPRLPESSPREYLGKLRLYTELFHSEKGRSTVIQYLTPPASLTVMTYTGDTLAVSTRIEWDGDITVRVNLDAIPRWNGSLLMVHQMAVNYAMERWRSRVEAIRQLARFGVKMHRGTRALAVVLGLTAWVAWGGLASSVCGGILGGVGSAVRRLASSSIRPFPVS